MKKFANMKGLIIGCGSIGERHLYNLKKIGIKDIAICDTDSNRVNRLASKYKTKKFYDLKSALSFKPEFSFICTYPNSHLDIANLCINHNSHLFIEKPISSELKGVEVMLKRARSKNLKVAVGYNLRFDVGLRYLKKEICNSEIDPLSILTEWGHNLKFWKPGTDYKHHYILKEGGGIILDDSHEYDYIRWLLGDEVESVYCQTRKITSIKTQTESIATMILKFRKGAIATLLLDYVRPTYERRCHMIGEKGDTKWQYSILQNNYKQYGTKANSTITFKLLGGKPKIKNFPLKVNNMYVSEILNFIRSIYGNEKLVSDGWDGLKTLQIGMAALKSAKLNKVIKLRG